MIKIGFIGVGNMAKAIIKSLKNSSNNNFIIGGFDIDKNFKNICKNLKIKKYGSNSELVKNSDAIFLSIKPQQISDVLNEIRQVIKNQMLISIAAGVSIRKIQKLLRKKIPVIRVMPNTPVLVGEGACGYSFSKEVSTKQKKIAEKIIKSFCKIYFCVKEHDIDVITSLSGSGPAYFFYIIEAMIEQAKAFGFNETKAKMLAAQTLTGTGKLLLTTGEEPSILRQRVTSKGGTTEAALEIFEKNRLKEIIKKGISAAYKRAKELGR
ncbi:MAG: pyrroline-5-carboxylate reductase [Candidatus Goldbacteria bacterium]|nr:pyrroline-5-carboxylate reductase [Candidatus Goldiibacteriota bacterium]